MPIYQNPVNTPIMSGFERQIAQAAEAGQTVQYTVTPIYEGADLVPKAITLRWIGSLVEFRWLM